MRTERSEFERYPQPSLPTVRDIVAVPFRHRSAVIMAFVLVAAAVVVSGVWLPKYEARMKILVQRQRSDAIVTSSANAPVQYAGDEVSEEDLNSEVELLTSDDLLRKVVLSTYLNGKPALLPDGGDDVSVAKAARKLAKDLKVDAVRKTHVISISYQARNPEIASAVLKTLAAAYTEKHAEVHRPSGEFNFFKQQAEQFHAGLARTQQQLMNFSTQSGVVAAQLQRDSALQKADEFDSNAHQAQVTLALTKEHLRALTAELQRVPPRMTSAMRTSDNPQLQEQLKSTLLNLELKRTELQTKYDDSYPLVQEVIKQITEAKAAIKLAETNPVREQTTDQNPDYLWVQGEITKAQAETSALEANRDMAKTIADQYLKAAHRIDRDGVVQDNLMRDVKVQEDSYLLYVHKREEAAISDALDRRGILNVAVAEEPIVPTLPTHSPLYAVMLFLLLGTAASLVTAFVADLLDPSFRTPDELANYLGTPVLLALPKARL
jgi:uncharacterized protein involved in exopolysaccharide biosynthesis